MFSIPVEKRDGRLSYAKLWMDKLIDQLAPGFYLMEFVPTAKRTLAQLKYYRGVILPRLSAEAAGGSYTPDEWHIILGNMFLRREVEYKGQIYYGIKSTSDGGGMTTKEFAGYLDQVVQYALFEHGVDIPPPANYDF